MKMINKEYWFVIVAGILSGFVVFGGKVFSNLGLSVYEISILPFAFAVIVLSYFIIFKKGYRPQKGLFNILLLYGLISAFIVVSQFGAVALGVSVAITILLLYTQPLWTILFSGFFLKEKITKRNIVACAIVLLGIFILVNPFQGVVIENWTGIILALIGGISLSGWVVVGSVLSKRGNHPINSLFMGNFFMIILLLLAYPLAAMVIHNESLVRLSLNFTPTVWSLILAYGFLVGVVVPLFYLNGVKKVPTVEAGIILLLEPISGAILALIFLGQSITLSIIIGGFLILSANYLVLSKKKIKIKDETSKN